MPPLNRIEPAGSPGAYQTYAITRRPDTLVKAACEQVGCQAWRYGWDTAIDETTELGRRQATYIRARSGRSFRELPRAGQGAVTVFRFEPHQRCFTDHQTIPEKFQVVGGDWRAYSGLIRRHTSGADWAEDMGDHLGRVADQQRKG